MCTRSVEVIPELKRHIHNLEELVMPMLVDEAEEFEEAATRAREREKNLSFILIVCWFLISRSKVVMNEMQEQNRKLESENKALQAYRSREKKLWMALALTWACIGLWHALMYRS